VGKIEVGRNQDTSPFVSVGEELKQQLGNGPGKRQVPKLVHQDKVVFLVVAKQLGEAVFSLCQFQFPG
jgi:hypothetical protein